MPEMVLFCSMMRKFEQKWDKEHLHNTIERLFRKEGESA